MGARKRARKRARRRMAESLVSAAYIAHVVLHATGKKTDEVVEALRMASVSTLRDANRMARLCGVETLKARKPAPTLHVITGGKGGA